MNPAGPALEDVRRFRRLLEQQTESSRTRWMDATKRRFEASFALPLADEARTVERAIEALDSELAHALGLITNG